MLIYVLLLREAARGYPAALVLFPVFATIVWVNWAAKVVLSRRYQPWQARHKATVSVIVPVVDEPVSLFLEVLTRIRKQEPHETIVIINGDRNPDLEDVCELVGVDWCWEPIASKRNAIRAGVEQATGEIVVLVDSDTLWDDNTLEELVKPFAEATVGGVTTRQRILEPGRSFLTRWADWMESSRASYSLPAQSVLGQVGCLPGRTIALRRELVEQVMPRFLTERFLGVHLEVSDDRALTNLALKAGYRCVYQSTALVHTDAPTTIRKLYRQQLRWSRGSQYNTLRMLPWMALHTPALAGFYAVDIVSPFLLAGCIFGWVYRSIAGTGVNVYAPTLEVFPGAMGWLIVGSLIVVGSTLSMWLRQYRHLREVPADWWWMPAYVGWCTVFLMPVRLLGFARMAHTASWGTRENGYVGGRRRLNPFAAIPYLLAALVFGAEVWLVAHA